MKRTFQLSRVPGKTILLGVTIALAICVFFEGLVRFTNLENRLPNPIIASGHQKLDVKLSLLDRMIEREGRVDCIFIGGSVVNSGIITDLFVEHLGKRTGRRLICFNFGLDDFIPPAAAMLADVLVRKYRPRMVIWGLLPPSFGSGMRKNADKLLAQSPWYQYHAGVFSLEGWLMEHSRFYGYLLRFRVWLESPPYSDRLRHLETILSNSGHFRPRWNRRTMLPEEMGTGQEQRFRRIFTDFKISPRAVHAFEKIVRLENLTRIIIVEMPVNLTESSFAPNFRKARSVVRNFLRKQQIKRSFVLIKTIDFRRIPADGWGNINHLNGKGAVVFTRWLGDQLADYLNAVNGLQMDRS